MRSNGFRTWTRLAIGGLAAALGLGTVAEVATVSAEPVNTDHTTVLDPASIPAPGTYSSCTAKFGLTKRFSDLVTFDVQDGAVPVSPTPVIGTDLIPLVTVSDGTTTVTCEATLAWTDATTFGSSYNESAWLTGTTMSYPGAGDFYLIPAINGVVLTIDGSTQFTPTTRTIEFANDLAPGSTVVASPAAPAALRVPYEPYGMTYPTSSAALSTPFFQRVLDAVTLTGSLAEATYLHDSLAENFDGIQSTCNDADATMTSLLATMTTLSGDWGSWMVASSCATLNTGTYVLGEILLQAAEVAQPAMVVTVSGPVPPTTTTVAPADPVTPAFTG